MIEQQSDGLFCKYGPWRFRALDPDDAAKEIERREPTGAQIAAAGL
jgi:hypothetical protein